jgi:hypothetical protein
MTLRREAADLVGTLISVEEEPYPDWDEQANGEPAPRRPVWTILTLDGRRLRWENVQVLRLPRSQYEWEYQFKHPGPGEHFRARWPATTPAGQCQVCAWEAERRSFLASVKQEEAKP